MERRPVGGGMQISLVGLGGAWLGHEPDNSQTVTNAVAVMAAAVAGGINWLDTSENYYDSNNEAVIGAALEHVGDDLLVCTKAAPGAMASGGGSGFRPEQIRRACEGSLRRLGRDNLDLYLLHWPDDTGVPLEDTWGAMSGLADDGLVRAIGMSNYTWDDIKRCHDARPVDVIQTGLSLIDYLDDRDLIAQCGAHGMAVTIYEPVGSGILTDAVFDDIRRHWLDSPWADSSFVKRLFSGENGERSKAVTEGLHRIAAETGATAAQLAIAWVLAQPGVTAAIAGSSKATHMAENAAAGGVVLTQSTLQALEDLIPLGPAFA